MQSDAVPNRLTEEQQAVIQHPMGSHALILAVAGSGKTSTLVERAAFLIERHNVPPGRILVLMFNALARRQFRERAVARGLPKAFVSHVHSFHSFSYGILKSAKVITPMSKVWGEEHQELQRICVHRAIAKLEKNNVIRPDEIDVDEAELAISLWKGALIPSDMTRAGYRGHASMPDVYREYETLRRAERGITFDDFVPLALREVWKGTRRIASSYDFVMVDEYQDVNFGQQALIESLAGSHADVMAVGDDDQTIYEWRGARPQYITRLFPSRFAAKPTTNYPLSRSFRFGPTLAQCAQNVVAFNHVRQRKQVIAHDAEKCTHIHLFIAAPAAQDDVSRELCGELRTIQKGSRPEASESHNPSIVVLGRTYSQLAGFEAELLRTRTPYRVIGQKPFYQRREVSLLLNYVRLAQRVGEQMEAQDVDLFLSVLNVPSRYLPRAIVSRVAKNIVTSGETLMSLFEALRQLPDGTWNASQESNLHDFEATILNVFQRLQQPAADSLEQLVDELDYREYFRNYYGFGEGSQDRLLGLDSFLSYVREWNGELSSIPGYVDALDSSFGAPEHEQVPLMTIYRTKGLEFDYVFIPSCVEGYMPFPSESVCPVFDLQGIVEDPESSDPIETERRLFYVAVTRARCAVFIGSVSSTPWRAPTDPAPAQMSRFIHELMLRPADQLFECLHDRDKNADERFRRTAAVARTLGPMQDALQTLHDTYLPAIGDHELASRLKGLKLPKRKAEFVYPEYYQPLAPRRRPEHAPLTPPPPYSAGWLGTDA